MRKVAKGAVVEVSRASLALAMSPARGAWHGARCNVLPAGWVLVGEAVGDGDKADSRDAGEWVAATVKQLASLPAALDAKWKTVKAGRGSSARAAGYFTLVFGARESGASYVPGEVSRGVLSLTAPLGQFFVLADLLKGEGVGFLAAVRYVGGVLYVRAGSLDLALDGWRHAEQVGEALPDVEVKLSARVVVAVDDSGTVVKVASKSSVILTGPYDVAAVCARLGEMSKNYGVVTVQGGGLLFAFPDGSPLSGKAWADLVRTLNGPCGLVKGGEFDGCRLAAPVAVVDSLEVVNMADVVAVEVAAVVPAVVEVAPVPAPAPVVLPTLNGERVSAYLARLLCPVKVEYVTALLVELSGGAVALVPVGMAADLAADVRRRVASLVRKDGRPVVLACAAD